MTTTTTNGATTRRLSKRAPLPAAPIQDTPTITTLSVDVQVIKIGRKQCTLAVFRQLDRRVFEDQPGMALWGRVSVCGEKMDHDCLNVVWSDGERLYRDHLTRSYHSYTPRTVASYYWGEYRVPVTDPPTEARRLMETQWNRYQALPQLFVAV